MKVLALDVATTTGVAIGDGTEPPLSFKVSFKGSCRGAVGDEFRKWLRPFVINEKPDLIAFEAPIVNFSGAQSSDSPRLLIGLALVVEMIAASRMIRCEDVQVQSWRKSFLGSGRPDNPKRATMDTCCALGWDIGKSDDRADACGVWAHAHLTWGNRKAMAKLLSHMTVAGMAR